MVSQQYLKIATGITVLILVGLIGYQAVSESNARNSGDPTSESSENRKVSLDMGSFGNRQTQGSEDNSSVKQGNGKSKLDRASKIDRRESLQLRVGLIRSTPTRSELNSIQTLPTLESKVRRLYSLAKDRACRMLAPGTAVTATLSNPKSGETGTLGRVSAITIGLEMNSAGRNKLPKVTRGQVDDYFAKHRLSIQPIVYYDATGQYYFGTDCQAAFFEIERPGIALKTEPMIEFAVNRFRALGVVGSSDELQAEGRTLMMAFTFEKSDDIISSLGNSERLVTELIFFHLPEMSESDSETSRFRSRRQQVPIDVFITSDERRNLHRLDLSNQSVTAPMPTISSDVRFDKMVLMGLYPAEPVVTDIHYRTAGIISMDLIQRLMSADKSQSGMSLDDVLDQFGMLSGSQLTSKPGSDGDSVSGEDEQWYKEIQRRKYERLEQALKPASMENREMAMPKVPMMSGLGK